MADPPPVALRTYTAIRLGVVVVIASLAWAVYREIANAPGHCVQRSLSAYYYTPVRPVFVAALVVIGFAMVTMWGMTVVEDAALNLAGLLLTVVALNPTLDASYCNVSNTVAGAPVPRDQTADVPNSALINANAATISRGVFSLLVLLTVLLVFIAVTALMIYRREDGPRKPSPRAVQGYVVTWLLAAVAVLVYWLLFWDANNWPMPPWEQSDDTVKETSIFYHQVHGWSANIAVALVFVAVVSAARQKLPHDVPRATWWRVSDWRLWTDRYAVLYAACACAMAVSALVFKGGDAIGLFSGWWDEHVTFLVEAVLISLIGVFWVIQTIDRRDKGAPSY